MQKRMIFPIILAVVIRVVLFSTDLPDYLSDRAELSTPISSWSRLTEGLTLLKYDLSPYDGDLYHEMPLTLGVWRWLVGVFGGAGIKYLFVLLDVVVGVVVYGCGELVAKEVVEEEKAAKKKNHFARSSCKLMLTEEEAEGSGLLCMCVYLLGPFSIACCLAKTTSILNTLTVALSFYSALKRNRLFLSVFLAFSTYLSFYPFILFLPLSILLAHRDKANNTDPYFHDSIFITSILQTLVSFSSLLFLLLLLSKDPDWSYLNSTFGFLLSASDHTPNIGVFWYFFVENFLHFNLFFLCVFQIHSVLYTAPLSIRLLHHPFFAALISLIFLSIFKSYPSYADISLWLPLVFSYKHLFKHTRNTFITSVSFVVCASLACVFEYLWVGVSSANANFYFAATLGITVSQLILLFDLLFAHQKRLFELHNGVSKIGPDGKPAKYLLQ